MCIDSRNGARFSDSRGGVDFGFVDIEAHDQMSNGSTTSQERPSSSSMTSQERSNSLRSIIIR
ncbi:uncharacterized protein LOC111208051 [Brassica napus]|uniref:uncharacterized protein LOC111208051 n=1 Tax=Brassica napus TaxID=3708 RepID=UPI00207AA8C7|nr:uncharacterized protein LOC111208051 [Brassica napus]